MKLLANVMLKLRYGKNIDIFAEKMWEAHIFAAKIPMYLKTPEIQQLRSSSLMSLLS